MVKTKCHDIQMVIGCNEHGANELWYCYKMTETKCQYLQEEPDGRYAFTPQTDSLAKIRHTFKHKAFVHTSTPSGKKSKPVIKVVMKEPFSTDEVAIAKKLLEEFNGVGKHEAIEQKEADLTYEEKRAIKIATNEAKRKELFPDSPVSIKKPRSKKQTKSKPVVTSTRPKRIKQTSNKKPAAREEPKKKKQKTTEEKQQARNKAKENREAKQTELRITNVRIHIYRMIRLHFHKLKTNIIVFSIGCHLCWWFCWTWDDTNSNPTRTACPCNPTRAAFPFPR